MNPTKPDRFKVNDILRRDRWQAKLDQQGYDDERMADIGTVMNALTSYRTGYMGSHLYTSQNCDRRLIGLDYGANRHCPTCGFERREEWRENIIDWSLDCKYFHIVFTLPHTLWPADLCQCEVDVPDPLPHCDSTTNQETGRRPQLCFGPMASLPP